VDASTSGFLDAWIDFGANGSWADAGDHVFASVPLSAGINMLNLSIPASATPGQTYTRFRFRTTSAPISYDGFVSDGEVEDYLVEIESSGLLPGDANCDGEVNVLDVVTIISYILEANPNPFCELNADFTGDGIINILDAVGIIDQILSNE
jgi:hypothetical protein